MALTFKKRDELDQVLAGFATLPDDISLPDSDKPDKPTSKSPDDFLNTNDELADV